MALSQAASKQRRGLMREIWKGDGKPEHGMQTYIAGKLKKKGGGSPSCPALHQLFAKVDADDDWFPGKAKYDDVGRLGDSPGAPEAH